MDEWVKQDTTAIELYRHNSSSLWLTYIVGAPLLFSWANTSVREVEDMLKTLPRPVQVSRPPPGM
jgi:hypothetical protein